MSKQVTVNVTKEDIRNGVPASHMVAGKCMVELALERTLGYPVKAGYQYFGSRDADKMWRVVSDQTHMVESNIIDFDAARPVEPFSFTIESVGQYENYNCS